jgi:glycosyltransferase involved in cell wall biosynthesis
MTTLYLCYQSLLDPLTRSQVVAYLEGLARAGYRPILVTFEPRRLSAAECARWERRLGDLGIRWRRLRYHKRPTVPATMLDIACGVALVLWLIARSRVRLVHARSHVAALMAAVLQTLTGVPFLFDVRGFLAEEYVDSGNWPVDGRLFRATKRAERWLVARAVGIVVLTHRAAKLLKGWYPRELAAKPLVVIPCCVDLRQTHFPQSMQQTGDTGSSRSPGLVYVGKLGGRYATRAMVDLFAATRRIVPGLHWTVLTQSDAAELLCHAARRGLERSISVGRVERDELDLELTKARAGLCLYRGDRSAAAVSPTKIAEYLAAGLPVVASAGMGDIDQILVNRTCPVASAETCQPVGVLVDERDPLDIERAALELARLMDDPYVRVRCQSAAEAHFDLATIGWDRYQRLYLSVVGHSCLERGWSDFVYRPRERSHRSQPVNSANNPSPAN